jgi:hypothetical protein
MRGYEGEIAVDWRSAMPGRRWAHMVVDGLEAILRGCDQRTSPRADDATRPTSILS